MATHWYCGDCKDGPFLIANNTHCPNCNHQKCDNCCSVATIYPKWASGYNDACAGTTDEPTSNKSFSPVDTPALTCTITNTTLSGQQHDTRIYTYGCGTFAGPTDGGEIVYRWTCCACSGDNSYDYSPGCTDCNNHWRCGGCTVYGVKYP